MKNYLPHRLVVCVFSLLTFASVCSAQDKTEEFRFINFTISGRAAEVMQDNEFDRSEFGEDSIIHCNPLLVNGEALDYETFGLSTRGALSLVSGIPGTKGVAAIRFNIFLRRNGEFIPTSFSNVVLDQADLEEVLRPAVAGDQLLIVPVGAENWKAKRVLKIIGGC